MFISMPREFFIPVVYVESFILNEIEEDTGFRNDKTDRESTEKKPIIAPSQIIKAESDVLYVPLKTGVECKINTAVLEEIDDEFICGLENNVCTNDKK